MHLRTLGRTGVEVSPICLGTLSFGKIGNPDHDECIDIVHKAIDIGINFIDTADVYNAGESEEIVGKALKGRRDDIVLATKCRMPMSAKPNERGASRRWIRRSCENSLRRLNTDYIDIYQMHRPDPRTDVDETLGILSDLIHEGKILYAGSSVFTASQVVESQWVAERRSRERFVCEQPAYSLLTREVEFDLLPTCQKYGVGVIPWGPLHSGWLSGRWRKDATEITGTRKALTPDWFDLTYEHNRRKLDAVEQLSVLAEEAGISLIHMAIAFVINHPAVTAAIIGPRTMEHFESQVGAADVKLNDDVLDKIDEIVPPGYCFTFWDQGPLPPSLGDPVRRRRSSEERRGGRTVTAPHLAAGAT